MGLFLPFESDHWPSIERFARVLQAGAHQSGRENISLVPVRPRESWKQNYGDFIGRRVAYTLGSFWQDFDVYHILDQSYSHLALAWPDDRVLITCHDLEFWRKKNLKNALIRRWILKAMLKANYLTMPSKTVQTEVLETAEVFRMSPSSVRVIYNSCGSDFKNTSKEKNKGRPVVLNIANTHWPRKNFSFLLQLLARLKESRPDILLRQIGPEFTAQHLAEIKNLKLELNIQRLEQLDQAEIASEYGAAWLYLQPSTYEGFGYPLLESVECGTPFVGSKIPVFEELYPVEGSLLELDINIWTKHCLELLERGPSWEQTLEAQRKNNLRYSEAEQVRQYLELYETISKN